MVKCKSYQDSTGFEGIKVSHRGAQGWSCVTELESLKSPREAIGEGTTLVIVEDLGLKFSWREIETCHYVTGLELLKRAEEMLLVNVQSSCSLSPQDVGIANTRE